MSHTKLVYHLVFATWHRQQTITAEHEKALYSFINNFSSNRGIKCLCINGMPDHVHILCNIPPQVAVADFIQILKSESSKYLAQNPNFPFWVKWGAGYYTATVDPNNFDNLFNYIKEQKQHHLSKPFADEYKEFLKSIGLEKELFILGDT